MSQMVRKQIYIQKSQEERLKKVAEARGVSEAEVIRQALEQAFAVGGEVGLSAAKSPLDEFVEMARSKPKRAGAPYQWNRQDAYEEREAGLMSRLSSNDQSNPA
jgi:hypothetical protein